MPPLGNYIDQDGNRLELRAARSRSPRQLPPQSSGEAQLRVALEQSKLLDVRMNEAMETLGKATAMNVKLTESLKPSIAKMATALDAVTKAIEENTRMTADVRQLTTRVEALEKLAEGADLPCEDSDKKDDDSKDGDSEKSDKKESNDKDSNDKGDDKGDDEDDSEKSDKKDDDSKDGDSKKSGKTDSDVKGDDGTAQDGDKKEFEGAARLMKRFNALNWQRGSTQDEDSQKSDSEKSDSQKSDSEKSDSEKSIDKDGDSEKNDEDGDSEKSDDEKSDDKKDDDPDKYLVSRIRDGHEYFERKRAEDEQEMKKNFGTCTQCSLNQLKRVNCVSCGWPLTN